MKDIHASLEGTHSLMVTEPPTMKMRVKDGKEEPVVNRKTKAPEFVLMVFAKPIVPDDNGRLGKGEEIKVNLTADPGEGFTPGTYVELLDLVVNTYEMRNDDGVITASGLWFRAAGVKPAKASAAPKAA